MTMNYSEIKIISRDITVIQKKLDTLRAELYRNQDTRKTGIREEIDALEGEVDRLQARYQKKREVYNG